MKSTIDYEHFVAKYFEDLGYSTEVTNSTGDYGVDVFAQKEGEKIAIQAKHYANGSRKVNRRMIMELHGAKDLFYCNRAILVTSGNFLPDAIETANKLGMELMQLEFKEGKMFEIENDLESLANVGNLEELEMEYSFQEIWDNYVVSLSGKTITGITGLENKIIAVDRTGITRLTSKGKMNEIPIEPFQWTYKRIIERGSVSRDEINQEFEGRLSSGVVVVFNNIPLYTVTKDPLTIRLKKERQ